VIREHFVGEIAGFGTSSGTRIAIGHWSESPLGAFTDAMLESASGVRTLVAPSKDVAEYVSSTYSFDRVLVERIHTERTTYCLRVTCDVLQVRVDVGLRTWPGRVVRLLPHRLASSRHWATIIDPVVSRILPGVHTRGSANRGRREWYGATDAHAILDVSANFNGAPLGELSDVDPPLHVGFGSTPKRPSVVALTTTVERAPAPAPAHIVPVRREPAGQPRLAERR
jgi:hypothetical protein